MVNNSENYQFIIRSFPKYLYNPINGCPIIYSTFSNQDYKFKEVGSNKIMKKILIKKKDFLNECRKQIYRM